ncbi:zinc finger C2HC domain-containing protein 1B-like [Lepeophtheirus salmonis]|uniref:zinc finger C2HC domain-containing protein 1B-like n=1 Tax=Lepeophtheirus salmonis TaxID=72036 RepID=UPI003AF3F2D8
MGSGTSKKEEQYSKDSSKKGKSNEYHLVTCKNCERKFTIDRISRHVEICKRLKNNNWRIFDIVHQRLKGTDAEAFQEPDKFVNQLALSKNNEDHTNHWKQTHTDMISAIRAAKKMRRTKTGEDLSVDIVL